jgi:hypothetical protein
MKFITLMAPIQIQIIKHNKVKESILRIDFTRTNGRETIHFKNISVLNFVNIYEFFQILCS